MKDGDVYKWRWNEAALAKRADHRTSGTLYWCEDMQSVAWDGRLYDTYWANDRLQPCGESHVVKPEQVELTFVCNLADVTRISEDQVKYYSPSDVFNLTYHAGHRKYYALKHGAQRDATAMREWVERRLNDLHCELGHTQRDISRLENAFRNICDGDLSVNLF